MDLVPPAPIIPAIAPTPTPVVPPRKPLNKKLLFISAAVVLVVLLLAAGGVMIYRQLQVRSQVRPVATAFDKNNVDKAISIADSALAKDPNNSALLAAKSLALSQKGSLTYQEGKYGVQAATTAEAAVKSDPTSSEAWRALGYAQEIQQNYVKAHEDYVKAIALNPHNVYAVYADAHVYDLEGNSAEAEKGYRAAIALNAKFDEAHTGLGRILSGRGDVAGALAEFKLAYDSTTNVHRKAEDAHSMAMLFNNKGDLAQARTYSEEATKLDPTYPLAWYGFGTTLFLQSLATSTVATQTERGQMIKDSIDALQKAIKLNPNQSLAYLQMGTEFAFIGQPDISKSVLARATQVVPLDITLNATDKADLLKRIEAVSKALQAVETKIKK